MISAIILAAGQSRRMGTNKLLLPFRGETMIRQIVRTVLKSRVDHVTVIVGHEADRVIHNLSGLEIQYVCNPHYQEGMLTSIRVGLEASPPQTEWALIVLGDQPTLESETIDLLLEAKSSTVKGILVPTHRGVRGHPLLFSFRFKNEVLNQFQETGLRGLLMAHPDEVQEVEIPSEAILRDVDRVEDYKREVEMD
ncbi:MAG: molybdenum cofactor cytidylyltransferase [Candidatus Omnitrophica bacterium]|nr:molybdenum cofactor cytidylyltransferase [Candidatus Omnitrophota bacterium]MCA9430975.1 molybdenum cofactor cytidylyltransferase [Candidatus Omnitrophota bacterium]